MVDSRLSERRTLAAGRMSTCGLRYKPKPDYTRKYALRSLRTSLRDTDRATKLFGHLSRFSQNVQSVIDHSALSIEVVHWGRRSHKQLRHIDVLISEAATACLPVNVFAPLYSES